MGKFGLVGSICMSKQLCPGAEPLKVKKPVYLREMRIQLHSEAVVYISLLLFPLDCE